MAKRLSRPTLYLGAAIIVALAALVWQSIDLASDRSSQASGTPTIGGAFTLVDHTGRTVTEADFKGRFMLVFFGYTYCPDVCPTALSVMTDALALLGNDAAKVQPLFVSVDPKRDTPEQLAMYVRHFDPRLIGLTGTPEQVAAAAKVYRIYFRKAEEKDDDEEDYVMDHTAIAYLMGPDGGFRVHFSHNTDAETMARRIKEFL